MLGRLFASLLFALLAVACSGAKAPTTEHAGDASIREVSFRARPPRRLDVAPNVAEVRWTANARVPGAPPRLVPQMGAGRVYGGAISDDGNLAVVTEDPTVMVLWDTHLGRELRRMLVGDNSGVCEPSGNGWGGTGRSPVAVYVRFIDHDRSVMVAVADVVRPDVQIWDVATGARTFERPGFLTGVSHDRTRILVAQEDHNSLDEAVIDTAERRILSEFTTPIVSGIGAYSGGQWDDMLSDIMLNGEYYGDEFSFDNSLILRWGRDLRKPTRYVPITNLHLSRGVTEQRIVEPEALVMVDARTGRTVQELGADEQWRDAHFSRDGAFVLARDDAEKLHVYHANDLTVAAESELPKGEADIVFDRGGNRGLPYVETMKGAIALNPHGDWICPENGVPVFHAADGTVVPFKGYMSAPTDVAVEKSVDGHVVLKIGVGEATYRFDPASSVVVEREGRPQSDEAQSIEEIARARREKEATPAWHDGKLVLNSTGRAGTFDRDTCTLTLDDPKENPAASSVALGTRIADAAVDPHGHRIALALDDYSVALFDEKLRPTGKLAHDGNVAGLAFVPDRDFLVTASGDGAVRVWDLRTNTVALRIAFWSDGGYIGVDAEGRFDTDRIERMDGIAWTAPDEPLTTLPVESFQRDYFTPGLARRILDRAHLDPVPDMRKLSRLQPTLAFQAITQKPDGTLDVNVDVRETATGASTARSRDLRLFRGGKLVARSAGDLLGSSTVTFEGIPVPAGVTNVDLAAYSFNGDGVKSTTLTTNVPVRAAPTAVRPRAFIVSVGVDVYADPSLDLDFAASDANTLATDLAKGFSGFDVHPIRVVATKDKPASASREAFLAVLHALGGASLADPTEKELLQRVEGASSLGAATPDDVVVVTFAGHGDSATAASFYLLFSDYRGGDPSAVQTPGSLSDADLANAMAPIDAREIVLIVDACQSAAAIESGGFKPGPLGSRGLGQMAYDKRMRVLTATQANDVALEAGTLGHGLLTYALSVEGLERGLADTTPRDGSITLSEWLAYGTTRVPELAREISKKDTSRGVHVARLSRSKDRFTQEPRLFDFAGAASTIEIVRTNAH